MAEKVFKKIRLTGCSTESYEKAIEGALKKASETLRGTSWFEVIELRGSTQPDHPIEWQATIDVSFKLD